MHTVIGATLVTEEGVKHEQILCESPETNDKRCINNSHDSPGTSHRVAWFDFAPIFKHEQILLVSESGNERYNLS